MIKTHNKTILYILTHFPVSTETFILNELRQVKKQNLNYYLVAFHINKILLVKEPYSEIEAIEIPRPYNPKILKAFLWANIRNRSLIREMLVQRYCKKTHHFFQALYLAKWAEEHNIKHIHAHYAYHSTEAARVISKLTGITYSFTAHANDIFKSPWQMKQKIEDAVFCATCTGYNANYLKNIYSNSTNKIFKVYHGIDLKLFKPIPRNYNQASKKIKLVSVARLREKKGFIYLIDAIQILKDKDIPVSLTIIGEGPERERLEKRIDFLGLKNDIQLIGSVAHHEVREYLQQSDIFILPSIIASDNSRDGIPNVILEAMAMELPVISTWVSAIPEAVEHEKTGLLVEPKDPEGIANAVIQLYKDPEKRILFGKRGRKKVKSEFDLTNNTKILVNLFEKVLNNKIET